MTAAPAPVRSKLLLVVCGAVFSVLIAVLVARLHATRGRAALAPAPTRPVVTTPVEPATSAAKLSAGEPASASPSAPEAPAPSAPEAPASAEPAETARASGGSPAPSASGKTRARPATGGRTVTKVNNAGF